MKKYLSLICFLFLGLAAFGQYTPNATWLNYTGRIKFSGTLRLPYDSLTAADTGTVIYKNGYVWLKDNTGGYVKLAKFSDIGGGGGGTWGSITGTLSSQTDLQTALNLNLKIASNLSDLASIATARTNLGFTTWSGNLIVTANPSAIRYIKINADNTVSLRTAAEMLSDLGGISSYTETDPLALKIASNLSDLNNAATARTNLGGTTVGQNFFLLSNPLAVTFPRMNADNTVSALSAAAFLSAIGGQAAGNYITGLTGDGTASGPGSVAFTLATVNSNVGTFNNVTVNAKGLVTAASNVSYLTANQTITVTGDASGSGSTAIALTLATVNANVGTFNNVTVNAKGLVTAASNVAYLTSYTETDPLALKIVNNLSDGTPATMRTNLGLTSWAQDLVTKANPSAIRYIKINADNTTTLRTAAEMLSDLGAQAAGNYITALTGDVTASGPGSVAATLATVNADVGTFMNATVTVDAKGRVTAASGGAAAGEANTASNLGGGLANYSTKVGVDLRFNSFDAADFDLASNLISIDPTKWLTITAGNAAYQPLDADLTTISGLTATTNNFMVAQSSAWASVTPATARTVLGGTTIGQSFFMLTNPSAVTFPQMNADNTVTALNAAGMLAAIGAQAAGNYITALTGDGSASGPGSVAFTLATVNSNVGTFNNVTVNAKGLVTAASNVSYLTSYTETDPLALKIASNLSDLNNAATARTNLGGTTIGQAYYMLTNPSAVTFPRMNADNTVSALSAAAFLSAIGGISGNQTITISGDASGSGATSIALTLATVNANVGTFNNVTVNAKGLVTAASNVSYLTSYTETDPLALKIASNLSDLNNAATARTNLGGTTAGQSFYTLTNPSAVTFPRINANNTVSALSAAAFLSAIGGQASGNYITALTGDVTASGPGSVAATLATVNANVGTFNNVTVNAKGLVTAASNVAYLTSYTETDPLALKIASNLSDLNNAATARTNLGLTTVGNNIATATNPSAVRWIRVNADNTINFRTAAETLSDIGAQATGNYITSLTGDGTASGPGAAALTLASVNSNVGSFTNANITVDAKGRITAASNGSAGSSSLNGITDATNVGSSSHANYAQTWSWPTLGATTAFTMTSSSTAAASNSQILMYLNLTGTNATASQTTTGLYVSNTHGGSGADNIAGRFEAAGGATNTAIYVSAGDIVFGTVTGTKIGTSTSQKLAFYNSTPIVKPSGNIITALSNLGLIASPTLAAGDIPDLSATYLVKANNLSDLASAATARTNLGGTTVGQAFYLLTNPSAITFPRINADNTVTALSASAFRTAIGAGTGDGTIVGVNGTANRITASGTTTITLDISATFEALLGKVANPLSQFAATTSAQLAGVISDETGSGALMFATAPTVTTSLTMADAANFVFNTTTGTKIGTTTSQKLAFYNSTPIVQPSGNIMTALSNLGLVASPTLAAGDIPSLAATYMVRANNLSDVSSVSTSRTNLGATTIGANIFTLTNPSAVRWIRINADNTATTRTAAETLSDLGAVGLSSLSATTPLTYNNGTGVFGIAGMTTIGTNGQLIRSNGTTWEYFTSTYLTGVTMNDVSPYFTTSETGGAITATASTACVGCVLNNSAGSAQVPGFTPTVGLGQANTTAGTLTMYSATSGSWLFRVIGGSGNHEFNMPLTQGAANTVLVQKGAGNPMDWETRVSSVSAGLYMSFSTITGTGSVGADTTFSTGLSGKYIRRVDSSHYYNPGGYMTRTMTNHYSADNKLNNYFMSMGGMGLDYKKEVKQTQTLSAGQNYIHGWIYARGKLFGVSGTTNIVYRFDNPDDLSSYTTATLTTGHVAFDLVWNEKQQKIYILSHPGVGTIRIDELDPLTMSITNRVSTAITNFLSQSITGDQDNLFIVGNLQTTNNSAFVKIPIATWTPATTTMTNYAGGHAIKFDGTHVYVTGSNNISTGNAWIAKTVPGTISLTYADFTAADFNPTDDLTFAGDYVWAGFEAANGYVVKVKKSDLTQQRIYTGVPTASSYGMFYDGKYVWSCVPSSPGVLVRIDPETHETARHTLESGENALNEIVTDGQRFFMTTYQAPAKVIRMVPPPMYQDDVIAGPLSPSQITSDQNDYNPTGLTTSGALRLSSDASRNITGIQAYGSEGKLLVIHNIGSQNIVLKDENASSTAAYRFALNGDITLGADQSITLRYDLTSLRWRTTGENGSAAGASGITVGSTTITSGSNSRILYNNSGVVGEYVVSGSGNVAMTTSPTFTTPALGTPSSATLTNATGLPLSTGVTGTLPVGNGGTGATSFTANSILKGSGSSAISISDITDDGTDIGFGNNTVSGFSAKYNTQTGTTYTLQSSDNGKIVTISNASAITLTVPTSLPAGFTCTVVQLGVGQITFTASSTTILNRQSFTKTAGQYAMATILQTATANTFITQGDMSN